MGIKVFGAKAFREELKGLVRDIRVDWLLEEIGVTYEKVSLDPMKGENKTPEYLALNPTGKVPTLVDDGFVLFESAAICEYLAEKYKKCIPVPGTPEAYHCKQWSYFTLTNLEPLFARVFGCDFFFEQTNTTNDIRRMTLEALPRFLKVLDTRLKTNDYLSGANFTIADIFLTTGLCYIKHTQILSDYPALKTYFERCSARPAFVRAHEKNGN